MTAQMITKLFFVLVFLKAVKRALRTIMILPGMQRRQEEY